jgi:glycosyltransferase involved in cell wall biosynthesis
VVFATQVVDADDPHLAQTLDMLAALAARCDELEVICDRVARHDLLPNVAFRTFGARSKAARAVRFERAILASGRPDAFLAHMVPRFLVLAAPLYRARRVPLLLWYTHWNASPELRLATRLCDAALSVRTGSFPVDTPKARGIGHAIDLSRFEARPAAPETDGRLRVLSLGRTEPRKQLGMLLSAVERGAERGLDLHVEIRGPQINEGERRHLRDLERRVSASRLLSERVAIEGPVSRDRVPDLIRAFDVVASLTRGDTRGGALDKVVYEAAACAVPVVACNPYFDDVLGGARPRLLFRAGNADDLIGVLEGLRDLSAASRTSLGHELRRRVERQHSSAAWADRVLAVVRGLERL